MQAIAFASGQGIVGTHVSAMPQDSITARYYAGAADSLINCDGSTVAATGVYYNTFAIVGGNLQCTLSTTIGGTTTIGTPVTLVAGVEDMVIQYAVSSTASCGASYSSATNPVDTYYRTAAMSGSGWCGVVSVQLSLLFDNPLYNASGPASQQWPQQNPFVQLTRLVNIMNRI